MGRSQEIIRTSWIDIQVVIVVDQIIPYVICIGMQSLY